MLLPCVLTMFLSWGKVFIFLRLFSLWKIGLAKSLRNWFRSDGRMFTSGSCLDWRRNGGNACFYQVGDYDIAGFCVGIVEKEKFN